MNKALIECFHGHKLSYYQYNCPKFEKKTHYMEAIKEEEEVLLVAYEEHK